MKLDVIKKIDLYVGITILYFLKIFRKKRKIITTPKKILLIKFFGFGNLIMIAPTIEELKKKYPNSKIDFLTLNQNKGIIENFELVNQTYYFSFTNIFNVIINSLKLIKKLKNNNYDLLIDFEQFARYSQILAFFINPNTILGYHNQTQKRDMLIDIKIKYNNNIHTVENFYSLIQPLIKHHKKLNLLPVKKNNQNNQIIKKYLKENKIKKNIIGIHIGVGENARVRIWPHKYYLELIEKLLNFYPNLQIVLTGANSEKKDIDLVYQKIKSKNKKNIFFSYSLKLKYLPYLISSFQVFISADTGPLHIAASQNIPVIGLYGPNTPKLYGPYTQNCSIFYKNLKCSPCITNFNNKETNCKNNLCMQKITVNEVLKEVKKYLK